jgi:ribosome-associated protein
MATVRDLVRAAVRAAEEKKARDVKAIDVRGLSSVTDYMVVASGSSDTNVRAIAESVRDQLLERGERPFSLEGLQDGTWVLLDYVDFVVHVFLDEKRLYFGLEELWADAKPVPIAAARQRAVAGRTGAAAKPAALPATRPAARAAAKEPLPQVPRAALKPAAKRTAAPKRAAAEKGPAPKKTTVPKRAPGSKRKTKG